MNGLLCFSLSHHHHKTWRNYFSSSDIGTIHRKTVQQSTIQHKTPALHMSKSPSSEGPTAELAAGTQIAPKTTDHEASTALAQDKIKKCQKLISMARYIRNDIVFKQSSAGLYPSAEDREGFEALKRQWRDLLGGKMLEGVSGDLVEGLEGEAGVELSRLDLLEDGEKVVEAREKWTEVLGLVGEWEGIKVKVEEFVAGFN